MTFDNSSQSANSARTTASDVTSILPILQQITKTLSDMQSSNRGPRKNKSTNRPKSTYRGPRKGQPDRPLPSFCTHYCWTHGMTGHKGDECKTKAPGHRDEATKDNRLGGSEWGCL